MDNSNLFELDSSSAQLNNSWTYSWSSTPLDLCLKKLSSIRLDLCRNGGFVRLRSTMSFSNFRVSNHCEKPMSFRMNQGSLLLFRFSGYLMSKVFRLGCRSYFWGFLTLGLYGPLRLLFGLSNISIHIPLIKIIT